MIHRCCTFARRRVAPPGVVNKWVISPPIYLQVSNCFSAIDTPFTRSCGSVTEWQDVCRRSARLSPRFPLPLPLPLPRQATSPIERLKPAEYEISRQFLTKLAAVGGRKQAHQAHQLSLNIGGGGGEIPAGVVMMRKKQPCGTSQGGPTVVCGIGNRSKRLLSDSAAAPGDGYGGASNGATPIDDGSAAKPPRKGVDDNGRSCAAPRGTEMDSIDGQDRRKRGGRRVTTRDRPAAIAAGPTLPETAAERGEPVGSPPDDPHRLSEAIAALRSLASAKKARVLQRFFQTEPGQYGHGDVFLGVTMPQIRSVAARSPDLSLPQIATLLSSTFHEERMLGVVTFVNQFASALKKKQESTSPIRSALPPPSPRSPSSPLPSSCSVEVNDLVTWYVCNRKGLNNWDLVDASAYHVIGSWVSADVARRKWVLYYLCGEDSPCRIPAETNDASIPRLPSRPSPPPLVSAHSLSLPPPPNPPSLWDVRIAIVANYRLINDRRGSADRVVDGSNNDTRFGPIFDLAERFYSHPHDLIHKALGWMLREAGKHDQERLMGWLRRFAAKLPRVMLRYAIEKLSPTIKKELMGAASACGGEDVRPSSDVHMAGDEDGDGDGKGTAAAVGRGRRRGTNLRAATRTSQGEGDSTEVLNESRRAEEEEGKSAKDGKEKGASQQKTGRRTRGRDVVPSQGGQGMTGARRSTRGVPGTGVQTMATRREGERKSGNESEGSGGGGIQSRKRAGAAAALLPPSPNVDPERNDEDRSVELSRERRRRRR
ncbi:hypothetical protein CBR_g6616 [Chara braunii]|uniref:Uncharacterized protein n=1 Tax=Chara braunii TaxID=69332 RepID=A0A388KKC9_CHABU|nr:hypothetical protein CBR_g6616 [Chara braunii]|eukprot:GBG70487.1 hypothetical protein CBR_g6616 [Chara braunii]